MFFVNYIYNEINYNKKNIYFLVLRIWKNTKNVNSTAYILY